MLVFVWGHIMLLPLQTGLYHDQRNYTSLTKTKPTPPASTSTYQPRVGPPDIVLQLTTLSYTSWCGETRASWGSIFLSFIGHLYAQQTCYMTAIRDIVYIIKASKRRENYGFVAEIPSLSLRLRSLYTLKVIIWIYVNYSLTDKGSAPLLVLKQSKGTVSPDLTSSLNT